MSSTPKEEIITLKIEFPPGCPTQYCTIRADLNATVLETLTSIIKKQNLSNPDDFVLYYPNPLGTSAWLNNNATIGSYSIKHLDLLEMKKTQQIVTVSDTKQAIILLLNINEPLTDLVAWLAVKLHIDDVDLPNYSLYNNGRELSLTQTAVSQCTERLFSFTFMQRSGSANTHPSTYSSDSSYADRDQSAAKLVSSCQLHGQLKKQTTKKSWKQRYFILKDNVIYYFHSLQRKDRRPAGVISLELYDVKIAHLQAKEAKYWALEFAHANGTAVLSNSPKHVRQHTSIIIRFDTESEMHAWLAACKGKKPSRSTNRESMAKAIFGAPLAQIIPVGAQIPTIVDQCIKYIEERVGIYRLSGSLLTIENWKKSFDKGELVDLSTEVDPHAVSGLLKLFLRELPEPLFTFSRYEHFLSAETQKDTCTRVRMIQELVWSLPSENQALLKALLAHLRKVCEHSAVNKMQMPNVATVFGPTLLRAKPVDSNLGFDAAVLTMVNDTPVINSLAMHVMNAYDYIFCGKEIKEIYVYARAVYSFKGEDQSTELSFDAGDLIKITFINANPNQWWMGEINGRSGCFPGGYVAVLHNDEQESVAQIQSLSLSIDSIKKHTQDVNEKVDTAVTTLLRLQKECTSLSTLVEHEKKFLLQAVLQQSAQFTELQLHTRELYKKLTKEDDAVWVSLDKSQAKLIDELDMLSHSKYKPKLDKEGFHTKLDSLRGLTEQCKTRRNLLKEDDSVISGNLPLLEKLIYVKSDV